MLSLISAAIEAITEGLKLIGQKEATKYRDQMIKIQLQIQKEEEYLYEADDAKIESLYKQLKIVMKAARDELLTAQTSRLN